MAVRQPPQFLVEGGEQLTHGERVLRRRLPALSDGDFDRVHTAWDEDEQWFVLRRGEITVAANLAGSDRSVPLPATATTVLIASADVFPEQGALRLPPDSVAVLGPTGSAA